MLLDLYSYWRSSAAFRVRIALNLKSLEYRIRPIHLLKEGGEHKNRDYLAINPQALVPTLVTDHGALTQSSAIIEYLEECYPEPKLLPEHAQDRAFVRSLAQMIACDIHPLNNLRVLEYLWPDQNSTAQRRSWMHHWLEQGLSAFETRLELAGCDGKYCFGDRPGFADLFLIPQIYNALRFEYPVENHALIQSIYRNCITLDAFQKAAPGSQPDAPKADTI